MSSPGSRPPSAVLDAWDVDDVVPLSGGQGETFRAGSLVFKPAGDSIRASWLADTLDGLPETRDVRVVRPARSRDGQWVVDGWTAWRWMQGEHRRDAWREVLEVSRRFHRVVGDVQWASVARGDDRWSVADRAAWGEAAWTFPAEVLPLVAALRPVDLPCQMIHGDLAGNVLFDDVLAPAVIDVSPYWRPAAYADAIVVADAVAWGGAGEALVEEVLAGQGDQLLMRAVLFRVAADAAEVGPYARLVGLLLA